MINKIKTLYKRHFYLLCIGGIGFIYAISLFAFWMVQRSPYRQYLKAAKVGDIVTVLKLAPKVRDKQGNTPLHYIVNVNDFTGVKWLLESGVDINQYNKRGDTPFMLAIANRSFAMAKWLLKNGATLDMPKKKQCAILHIALVNSENELVETLFTKGIDANISDDAYFYNHSPLYWAIHDKNIPMIKLLLRYGAKVKHHNQNRVTPLHAAVRINNVEILQLLLEAGADINFQTLKGKTPLHFALNLPESSANNRIIQILLKKGVNLQLKDYLGKTPLVEAVLGKRLKAMKWILQNGGKCTVNITTKLDDISPLYLSVCYNHLESVQLLLEYGANPNHRTSSMLTPLHAAVDQNNVEIAKLLLQYGAQTGKDTAVLIRMAKKHQNSDMVRSLKAHETLQTN